MTELDRLANMAEIISAVIVVGGILFALLQMRQTRQQRRELDAPNAFEWFQWLAERLEDLNDGDRQPAYEAHTNWKPSNQSSEL